MLNRKLNPISSLHLFGYEKNFDDFISLIDLNKFPKVSLFSGKKGSGKFTLAFHLLAYIFDKKGYDLSNRIIDNKSVFYNLLIKNIFSNIIILSVERNNIKIDDIRKLKAVLFQSSIDNNPRYIILDDVELYNINSLNALLKIIEEPTHNNHFILINSQEKEIPQTIRSRCIETKFFIFNDGKNKIIKSLLNKYDIETIFDYTNMSITPGNFLHFNQALIDNDIDINNSYDNNIMKLLSLHKKTKNMVFIKLSIFLTDQYFYDMSKKHNKKTDYFNNLRITIIKSINDFVTYNLNINLVINSINEQLNYER